MIEVRRTDLSSVTVEAILRPVNAGGDPVSTAGRNLETAAGEEVVERLRAGGEIPVGGAVLTPGGNLSASFVIHVVVQSADEAASAPGVRRALVNGLRRASDWGIRSLALPPLGAGPLGLDAEEAAGIVLDVLGEHLRTGVEPQTLVVAVETDFEEKVYRGRMSVAAPPADESRE